MLARTARFAPRRLFSTSSVSFLQKGDIIPSVETLREDSPGNEVDFADLTKSGKSVIVGVPGAFSPACSASHVPGYISNYAKFASKGYNVYITGVNDAFVFKAWKDELLAKTPELEGKVRFIADPSGDFAKASELAIDASKFFGGVRDKRFALVVADGKVVDVFEEPDNFGISVSAADKVLEKI